MQIESINDVWKAVCDECINKQYFTEIAYGVWFADIVPIKMENGKFTFESGTPPDYFNEDGQKWGNPVYSVEYMREDNYKYLIRRFKYMLKMFDKISKKIARSFIL